MKTIFNIMLHILLFLLILFAQSCTSKNEDIAEIKFWAMGAEGEHVQKLLPAFERQHPDVNVSVQMIPWTAAQEKLITAFASDNLPDLFQLGNTWIPQFVALGALENLDPYIMKSKRIDKENYFEGIWKTNIIEDAVYGIPWYIDTRVLFYRSDILRKVGFTHPPETWNELYTISKLIREQNPDREKYAIFLPTNEWAPFVIFGLQAGSSLLTDNNCYGNFSGEKFKKAFEFLIRFHKEGLSPLGVSQVSNVYQAFAEGYFVMYISGPWNIREFKYWMRGDLADKWMTAPLPAPDKSSEGVSLAGGSSLVIAAQSRQKEAAWKLIEYLSEKETQLRFYQLVDDLPAVKATWQDSVLSDDPYIQAFFIQFQHVVATPKIPEWEQIAFAKIQQYAEIAARGVMTVEQALEALDADVDRILEKRRWLLHKQ